MLNFTNYEKLKEGTKELECDKCKYSRRISTTQILNQSVRNENKQSMMVYYFTCPQCGEIYIISIIDFKTQMLLEKSKKLTKLINRGSTRRKDVSKEKQELESTKQQLLQRQKMLKDKYGKHFYLRKEEATTANVE